MNKIVAFVLILSAMMGVACSDGAPAVAPEATEMHKTGTIRFALQGGSNITDVPSFMALDSRRRATPSK
jgi:hypothetical protein